MMRTVNPKCFGPRLSEESHGRSGLCRFSDGYLQAVHSIDRKTLAQSAMEGLNRIFLRFYQPQAGRAAKVTTVDSGFHRWWETNEPWLSDG